METQTPPRNLRTILLATPKKTRRTKKFTPPVYTGKTESGVRPGAIRGAVVDNWRINTLATPTLRRREDTTKCLFREPGVLSQTTLKGKGTVRTDDLAITPLRKLRVQRKTYGFLGPRFTKIMDKNIDKSWKSLYHYYDRKLLELKKKRKGKGKGKGDAKGKGKKGSKDKGKPGKQKSPKELMEERLKKFAVWAATAAQPKKIFKPKPGKPRKIADLQKIGPHMSIMARPHFVTKKFIRPSIDPEYVDPLRVSDGARSYEISERVKKLAECPAHRLIREPVFKPGAVKRSALTCKVSPRFAELSVPRKTAKEKDTELKENPFEISKNALKYKASARILELAKPTERD